MTSKSPRHAELSELVAYHFFRYIDRDELVSVMHVKFMADEFRDDHARTTPSFYRHCAACRLELHDFLKQLFVYVRTFFLRSRHNQSLIFIPRYNSFAAAAVRLTQSRTAYPCNVYRLFIHAGQLPIPLTLSPTQYSLV